LDYDAVAVEDRFFLVFDTVPSLLSVMTC